MKAVRGRFVPIIVFAAVILSLVAVCAYAGSATMDSGSAGWASLQSIVGSDASTESEKLPADESPYESVASVGDSVSAGYGPLMGDNTWSNYYYATPPAGSYPYELTEDLGLSVSEDFNSMLCVDQRLIDVYYAMGGNPDPVVDPDSIEVNPDEEPSLEVGENASYETLDYLEDARIYHSESYMKVLEDLHESGEGAQRIADSDLITVMIGMADLAVYPVKRTKTNGTYDMDKAIAMMRYGFASYEEYYPKLIKLIKALNPDAKVCILGLYDPYAKLVFEGEEDRQYYDLMAAGIDLLNVQLKLWCALYGCTYVDVSGTSDYIDNGAKVVGSGDFATSLINHENHPGAAGHKYIENQILDALGLQRASKTPSTDSGVSYLAFTSDIHNSDSDSSAQRLDAWLDDVSDGLGDITFDYLGVCGDVGSASLSGSAYASKVQMVMDTVDENTNVMDGIYTTGNHEYSPGTYATDSAYAPYSGYTRLGEAADTDTYRIYCFGAAQYNQAYSEKDIDVLAAYLDKANDDEPIFVLSHFPIHTSGSRSTTNADRLVEVLNEHPNVIFIWGHNHTLSDSHYDTVYSGDLDGTPINFVYCSAGCMSDADYSSGSGSVLGKGLVAAIDGDDDLTLTYYDKEYRAICSYVVDTAKGSALEVDVPGEEMDPNFDLDIYSPANTLAEGEYVFTVGRTTMNSVAHEGYTCSNNGYTYSYPGLCGGTVAISSDRIVAGLTEDEVWTVAKADGGYTVQNKKTGQYLTGYYYTNAGAKIALEGSAGENGVWTYEDGHLKNVATGKYLNFEVAGDVDGTLVSGETDLFTLRSSATDTISLYSNAAGGATVASNYSAASGFANGSWYLLTAEDYAVTGTSHDGYVTVNGGSTYKYTGLAGTGITAEGDYVTSKVSTGMLWQAVKVNGGFALKNAAGAYLNASYSTAESGYVGVGALYAGDEPQAWTLSGTALKNVSSGKYFNYQSDSDIDGTKQSGSSRFFTVRSSSKDAVTVYLSANGGVGDVDENEALDIDNQIAETRVVSCFDLVTSGLEDGAQVMFASKGVFMTDEANNGYKTVNNSKYYSYSGLSTGDLGATAGSDISGMDVDATVWTVETADGGYYFTNSAGKYLSSAYDSSKTQMYDESHEYAGIGTVTLLDAPDASSLWTFSIANNVVALKNKDGKVLTYNSGSNVDGTCLDPADKGDVSVFTVRSGATNSLYLYRKTEKRVAVLESGGSYLMVSSEGYAVSSDAGEGYNDATSTYRYDGLAPVAVEIAGDKVGSVVTNEMMWTFTENGGGYTIRNAEGKYLNSVYVIAEGGAAGEGANVFLSDTPEIWDVRSGYLVSETTGKYLSRQTNSGETSVFTLRSSASSAQPFEFYSLIQASTVTALYASGVGGTVSTTREVLDGDAFERGEASFAGATAVPREGYTFLGWYSGDTLLTTEASYVPAGSGVYKACFEEGFATIRYRVMLKDGVGDPGAIVLSNAEESNPAVTGTVKGSIANAAEGYTFLYWTSDEAGDDIVARVASFVPARAASDAEYYAWYRMDPVCFETVTEELEGVVAGTHHLVIDGADLGVFVFTEEDGGWSLYSAEQQKFLSVNSENEVCYSSVSETWSYGRYGFSVSVWDRALVLPVKTTYYLGLSDGEPALSVRATSSTALADVSEVGYTSHAFDAVSSVDGETHTLACSRCGLTAEAQEHEFATCVDKGDGTHAHVCEACGYEEISAHTVVVDPAVEPTTEASGLTEGSHCSECGAVITAQEVVGPIGHTHAYGEWTVTKAATLGAEGQRCRTCGCGAVETEAIPALTSISLTRLSGIGRYDTMAAISAAGFERSDVVVVASGVNYPDALSATGLAGLYDAPVLLSSNYSLSEQVASEITRLGATRAIIVGGTAALSESVESELQGLLGAGNVVRVYGSNRVATSIEVYEYGCIEEEGKASWGADAIVASSLGYADALSASPYSYAKHAPILLTNGFGRLTDEASEALSGFSRVLLAGGELVVSSSVEDELGAAAVRLAGANRYATSAAIASFCISEGMGANGFAIATGSNYPDALAGGAFCGHSDSVVLLVSHASCSSALDVLKEQRSAISSGYVLGGSLAVPDYLKTAIENGLAEG